MIIEHFEARQLLFPILDFSHVLYVNFGCPNVFMYTLRETPLPPSPFPLPHPPLPRAACGPATLEIFFFNLNSNVPVAQYLG